MFDFGRCRAENSTTPSQANRKSAKLIAIDGQERKATYASPINEVSNQLTESCLAATMNALLGAN